MIKVFVYGTLKIGEERAKYLNKDRLFSQKAILKNAILINLGEFPGLILNKNGIVYGEIHTFSNKNVLQKLDHIEGYIEELYQQSLYVRKKVKVFNQELEKEEEVFVYEYNGNITDGEIIKSGVW